MSSPFKDSVRGGEWAREKCRLSILLEDRPKLILLQFTSISSKDPSFLYLLFFFLLKILQENSQMFIFTHTHTLSFSISISRYLLFLSFYMIYISDRSELRFATRHAISPRQPRIMYI